MTSDNRKILMSALALNLLLAFVSRGLCNETVAKNPVQFVTECGGVVPPSFLCDPLGKVQDRNVTSQLAKMNNNTEAKGVINWEDILYYGYIVGVAVIDAVQPLNDTDSGDAVEEFGEAVQKSWFGGRICDNSTLVLLSLDTSRVYLFPGEGTDLRLRTHHKEVCSGLRAGPENATETLMTCLEAFDEALLDAMRPWSNAVWGYSGIVIIMTMLIFHYWIK